MIIFLLRHYKYSYYSYQLTRPNCIHNCNQITGFCHWRGEWFLLYYVKSSMFVCDKLTRNLSPGLLTNWPPIVHAGKLIFIDLLRVSVQERLCLRQKYIDIIQHQIILHFMLLKCVLYTDTVMDIGQCFSVYVCMYEWLLRCVVTYLYRW